MSDQSTKNNLATKDDLRKAVAKLATKDDLKRYATKDDLKRAVKTT
ncbi:MAG: hypothetical protein HYV40_02105 [Candidatus Levybacteria bacterium]|nr:hypothetical protein [Candidatus Levybacteria bacterium]